MNKITPLQVFAVVLFTITTAAAQAPEEELDADVGRALSGATMRALQAQVAEQPPTINDKHVVAIFYHKRGMANQKLGRYEAAIADLRSAIQNNQSNRLTPDDWGNLWRIQLNLGSALAARGNWSETIPYWENLARQYAKTNLYSHHFLQLTLAGYYQDLGQWANSEKALHAANETIVELRKRRDWYYSRWNVEMHNAAYNAYAQMARGNLVEAERLRRLQLDFAQRDLEFKKEQYRAGDARLDATTTNISNAKLALANALAARGKNGESQVLARSGLEDRLGIFGFASQAVGGALATLAYATSEVGDFGLAEKYYRHALSAQQKSGATPYSIMLAARRNNLGYALLLQARWGDANRMFEDRDRGLRQSPEQFKRFGSNTLMWALSLYKTGEFQRAETMAGRIVTGQTTRPTPNLYTIALARGTLALAQSAQGKLEESLKNFQQAIPELLKRDSDDDSGAGTVARTFWSRNLLEGYIELLGKFRQAGNAPAGLEIGDESFRMADVARGSVVQAAIGASAARAQLPDAALADLARRDQDALNRIGALNLLLGRLASAPEAERLNKVIAEMQRDIASLRKERASLQAQISKRFPEYADLLDPKPAGLADARKAMAQNEALVSLYLGEKEAYVWTLGLGNRSSFRVVPITRAEVEIEVATLRRSLDVGEGTLAQMPAFNLTAAHKLYKALLAPDEALWQGASVLNVIPHGALAQLPFSVLVTTEATQPDVGPDASYRQVPWLTRKVAIAQLPSANAFIALRRAPAPKSGRESFVGFGNPLFTAEAVDGKSRGLLRNLTVKKIADNTEAQLESVARGRSLTPQAALPTLADAFRLLASLPDTADELREIASVLKSDGAKSLFLGRQATERNVKNTRLDNRKVVAFATHGLTSGDVQGLDQPALVLSNPALTGEKDEDGFLTLEEVLALKLDADWVVLSACNTASADGRASEAVSGLGRAFFFAGARSLLVSNWAVETVSARLLTTELFRRQSEDANLSRAEALRQSMLSLMDLNSPDGYSFAHPMFWAPFSLVGDGRP